MTKVTRTLCLGAFALATLSSQLHAQVIRGSVHDASSKSPIPGALVTLLLGDSVSQRVTTDPDGTYSLTARADAYVIRVTAFGYFASDSIRVHLAAGASTDLDIALRPSAILLERIEVSAGLEPAREGFERRRSSGDGTFFDGIQIALQGRDRTLNLMATAPGFIVDVENTLRPLHPRSCLVVFLDYYRDPIFYSTGTDGRDPARRRSAFPEEAPVRLAFGGFYSNLQLLLQDVHVRGIEMYREIMDIPEEIRNGPRQWQLRPFRRGCGAVFIWTNDSW